MASTSKTSHFLTQEDLHKAHRDLSKEIYDVPIGSPVIPSIKMESYNEVPQLDLSKQQKAIEDCFKVFDLKNVGCGSYGSVFNCKDREDHDKQFAVKVIKAKFCDKNFRDFWIGKVKGELAALKRLQHPNILKYDDHCWLDHSEQVPRCYLVVKTEYLDQTLSKIIEALRFHRQPMEYDWIKRLFEDIASALVYMHDLGMVHHDLKHNNVMITRVKSGKKEDLRSALGSSPWKIIDVGNVHYYSGPKDKSIEETFFDGTALFSCPDKRGKVKYQPFKSDSYSFAMLLWEAIVTNEFLFAPMGLDRNDPDYIKKLRPAWEIIDGIVIPKLRQEGKVRPLHVVARQLIAPEEERIYVSEALELLKNEEQKLRESSTELNKRQRLV